MNAIYFSSVPIEIGVWKWKISNYCLFFKYSRGLVYNTAWKVGKLSYWGRDMILDTILLDKIFININKDNSSTS